MNADKSSLSRIATALGLPETAGEEEIVERCKELGGDQEGTLLHAIGAELAQAVATSSGVPGLSVEALRFLETRVHHYLNGAQLQEGTVTQQFVELLASDIRPHLLPTLAELKRGLCAEFSNKAAASDWFDRIVAAAQRDKAKDG